MEKEGFRVFFKQSIACDKTINNTDGTYIQYILVSHGSNYRIRKLSLKAESPNLDVNINLIVFKEDNLNNNRIIVFFADSNDDTNIRYAVAQQVDCTNFKNAGSNFLDLSEIKNALDKTALNIKCLTYDSSFSTTKEDTCSKIPNNSHNITITHENVRKKVAVYNSTWKTSVCYKVFGNFQVL